MNPPTLHAGANGERWLLARGSEDALIVRHVAAEPSGGQVREYALAAFLARNEASPQRAALLGVIQAALDFYLPVASAEAP